jgi:hypothetical protein
VSVTHLSGRHARIDVSLDGIRFTRTESDATRRDSERVRDVGWDQVMGATVQTSRKGRPIVRVAVAGARAAAHHRDDPYAVKVRRGQTAAADEMVAEINAEVEVRNRWRERSRTTG